MKSRHILSSISVLTLCLSLAVACAANGISPTSTVTPTQRGQPTQPVVTPLSAVPTATRLPFPSSTVAPSLAPTVTPAPTPTPAPASWYGTDAVALFVGRDYESGDLYALDRGGETRMLLADVGERSRVSPDGRWLGFFRRAPTGQVSLELHDAASGERRIIPDLPTDVFPFAFDAAGQRLAYLGLGKYGPDGVPWVLVVVDLDQGAGAGARYAAQMANYEDRPLPGYPLGWSQADPGKDELLFDTFVPATESGWMGLWGVTLPADGASAPLDRLSLREWVPGAPVYFAEPELAPDGQSVAFLGRDLAYQPQGYAPEFYNLAVNRLEVVALSAPGPGTRATWIALDDGSALGRALAWSPDSERLLFAQGRYEGEQWATLMLKSTDQTGAIREYGPLGLSPVGALLDLAWCDVSLALYVLWDGQGGTQRLFSFDLENGLETEIIAAQRIKIVGCAP